MKNKIIMLLSFLMLISTETMAQLTRLKAGEITDGKRIYIRKISKDNRDLWTAQTGTEGSYVYVVEATDDNKVRLKREVDNLYLGNNGTSIKMVSSPDEAVPFSVITPVFGGSGDNLLTASDESLLPKDMNKDQIVRFSMKIDDTTHRLNLNSNNYAQGTGIWSACEVLEITGSPTTPGEPLPVGDKISPVYIMWKTNDGKVLSAKENENKFAQADYKPGDPMQQWQTIDAGNGNIKFYNVGSGLYLGLTKTSTDVIGWKFAELGCLYEPSKVGKNDVFAYADKSGDSQYLHCNGGNLVGWNKGEENGSSASQWKLVKVDSDEMEQVQQNFALRNEFTSIINNAFGFGLSIAGLIRSAEQLSTPFQEKSEGPIGNLIDGNTSTFFHTNWSASDPEGTEFHYFDVTLNENEFTKFCARYAARNGNDRPTEIKIYGRKDNSWGEEPICTLITENGLGNDQGIFEFNTNDIVYDALRFAVTKTNSGNRFFTYGEFQLFGLDEKIQQAWNDLEAMIPGVAFDYVTDNFEDKLAEATEISDNLKKYLGAADITYDCYYKDQEKPFFTTTTSVLKGEKYPTAPDFSNRLLTLSTDIPSENVQKAETIKLTYTYNDSPIVFTTIENGEFAEGTVWYTIHLPANENGKPNMLLNGSGDTCAGNSFEQIYDENAWFCFVGDPANGFQVYSKKYGANQPLNRNDNAPSVNGSIETKWLVFKNGDNFTVRDYTDSGKWWNQLGGYNSQNFGFYSGGSPIQFFNSVETAQNMIEHSPQLAAVEGYIGGLSAETMEEINTEASTNGVSVKLRELMNNIKNEGMPIAGKYYRITNVERTNITLGYSEDIHARGFDFSKSSVGQIYEFIPVPAENGFRLKNLNTGKFISALKSEGDATLEEENNAALFRLIYLGEGQNNIVDGAGSVMHCASRTGGWQLMAWGGGLGSASAWYITEATDFEVALTTIDGASYATVYLPFAVQTTKTTQAYTAKQNAEHINLIDPVLVSDNIVPAGEGVILKDESAENITLNIVTTDKQKDTNNLLTGTFLPISDISKEDYYIFGNTEDDGLGFYRPNATTLVANKAFINNPTNDAQFLKLNFGGNVTGINAVETTDNESLYDLSGRRVVRAVKGIYIRNGKRIYVK